MTTRQPQPQLVDQVVAGVVLDWRHATVLPRRQTCVSCYGLTLLVDPDTGRPCHKTCAEREVEATARRLSRSSS